MNKGKICLHFKMGNNVKDFCTFLPLISSQGTG